MRALELKIPPVALVILTAALMCKRHLDRI
jgi:hypothetical protein